MKHHIEYNMESNAMKYKSHSLRSSKNTRREN